MRHITTGAVLQAEAFFDGYHASYFLFILSFFVFVRSGLANAMTAVL